MPGNLTVARLVTTTWTVLEVPVMPMTPAARIFFSRKLEEHVNTLVAYIKYMMLNSIVELL